MEKLMRVIRLNAPNDFEYTTAPIPEPGEYEVLCRVESVSICGTDPHIIKGDFPGVWPKKYPLIPGHEWSGVIVGLGAKSGLFGWHEGQRVSGIANCGCGFCKNCREGRFTLCENYGDERVHRMYGHISQGAYAQYIAVNIKSIAEIPDSMDFNVASVMDTLSIALHMVMHSHMEPGDDVLVNGAGAQGWMSIICLKSMGAGRIFCSGSGERLEMARKLGAIPINYKEQDVIKTVTELTNGRGVKRVMECTGTAEGVRTACYAVSPGGTVSMVGFPAEDVAIPIKRIVMNEIELLGNRANPNTLEKAIVLAKSHMDELCALISHEFPMSRYREAYDTFTKRLNGSLKVVVKPQL